MHSAIQEAVPARRWVYPEEHLATIGPFIWGNQLDPRGAFTLNSNTWDAWPYAANAREAWSGARLRERATDFWQQRGRQVDDVLRDLAGRSGIGSLRERLRKVFAQGLSSR